MPRGGNVLRQRLAFRKQLQGREPPRSRHHLIGAVMPRAAPAGDIRSSVAKVQGLAAVEAT
jgi:hypothetical protein